MSIPSIPSYFAFSGSPTCMGCPTAGIVKIGEQSTEGKTKIDKIRDRECTKYVHKHPADKPLSPKLGIAAFHNETGIDK